MIFQVIKTNIFSDLWPQQTQKSPDVKCSVNIHKKWLLEAYMVAEKTICLSGYIYVRLICVIS